LIDTSLFGSSADFAPDSILIAAGTQSDRGVAAAYQISSLAVGISVVRFHPCRVAIEAGGVSAAACFRSKDRPSQ
jgi:hypothetical protein